MIEVHRETVRVTDGAHEHLARPLPGLLRSLADTGDALTVGDWLSVQHDEHGTLVGTRSECLRSRKSCDAIHRARGNRW